ncbi:hypothetical protein [Streptomyces umbrinus]|uniref:hypothetical protein n=1 Tax=Streptomyces umbrinus TaxID=67370 RepID=UPI0033DEC6DF
MTGTQRSTTPEVTLDSPAAAVLSLHRNAAWPQPTLEEHDHRSDRLRGPRRPGRPGGGRCPHREEYGAPMHAVAGSTDGTVAVTRPDLVKSRCSPTAAPHPTSATSPSGCPT